MKSKKSTGPDMKQDELTQCRYPGSEVPGMEYTTALPIGCCNAAPTKLPPPNQTWPEGGFRFVSTTKGK